MMELPKEPISYERLGRYEFVAAEGVARAVFTGP